ncbi:hypothetical protein HanIR_Chr05g0229941 [Helianthus annuus]|nr:hypothetical protein HanIR_Chr05g0229941 [Helianthus annuus]
MVGIGEPTGFRVLSGRSLFRSLSFLLPLCNEDTGPVTPALIFRCVEDKPVQKALVSSDDLGILPTLYYAHEIRRSVLLHQTKAAKQYTVSLATEDPEGGSVTKLRRENKKLVGTIN